MAKFLDWEPTSFYHLLACFFLLSCNPTTSHRMQVAMVIGEENNELGDHCETIAVGSKGYCNKVLLLSSPIFFFFFFFCGTVIKTEKLCDIGSFLTKIHTLFGFHQFFHEGPLSVLGSNVGISIVFCYYTSQISSHAPKFPASCDNFLSSFILERISFYSEFYQSLLL